MVNDRGTMKWTSLMLPEHVEMLNRLWNEETEKTKPILADDELEHMNEVISQAYKHKSGVSLTVYQDKDMHVYQGTIHSINLNRNELKLVCSNPPGRITILLSAIIHADTID